MRKHRAEEKFSSKIENREGNGDNMEEGSLL
jgi:hypothetical protein